MSAARHIKDSIAESKRLQLKISKLIDFERDGQRINRDELLDILALTMMAYSHMCMADTDLTLMPQCEDNDRRVFHVEQSANH